jgi:hypothetical protein
MLNPFQLLGPWMMIGGAALLLLIFVAVFVWNSPRRRAPVATRESTTPMGERHVTAPQSQ